MAGSPLGILLSITTGSNYSVQGTTATYAVTASSATPKAGWKVTGATASYAETASSLTPKYGAKLSETTAAYSLTATNAWLLYGPSGVVPSLGGDWLTIARRRGRR